MVSPHRVEDSPEARLVVLVPPASVTLAKPAVCTLPGRLAWAAWEAARQPLPEDGKLKH